MSSPSTQARTRLLTALRADSALLAKVPRLYGWKVPKDEPKPFGRAGPMDDQTERPSGWTGAEVSGAYHVFVGTSASIADPEGYALDAIHLVRQVIEGLPDFHCERTQVIPDSAESDVYHGIAFWSARILDERP